MLTAPPTGRPELLLVGGLTVDRLPDGSQAAGGAVLHAARAMWLDGRRIGVLTVAGDEPPSTAGLVSLHWLADLVKVLDAPRTISFGHDERDGRRQLTFLASAGPMRPGPPSERPSAVLFAPVADELEADLGGVEVPDAVTGAVLQGWLRELDPGATVRPRRLGALPPALLDRLRGMDLLVASTEDLAAEAPSPAGQLDALRTAVGPRPVLALTGGVEGAWISVADEPVRRVRPPRLVNGVSTIGAGDAFAATMLAAMGRGIGPLAAAEEAALLVAEFLAERAGRTIHVVGDVHGMLDILVGLLREAGLVGADLSWTGGRDELWLTGDLTDRGPSGAAVVELLMRLQAEAEAAGGRVGCVAGNHELLILAAREMPDQPAGGPGGTFRADWLANGGRPADLAALRDEALAWLRGLPVMARVGPGLLVHADAPFYADLGRTVAEANRRWAEWLARPHAERWDHILAEMTRRRAFVQDSSLVDGLLQRFGGRQLVHGHTPIPYLAGGEPGSVRQPYVYAGGRAVAVDPGFYAGSPGFAFRLASWPE
ncbi:MAG TPA: PfkB family carbohydrate kinase [candidate division Zixibacteria bacterium]|nr:PfkB family carbohydrate kinase [candidate division Zixibacteria bacterium]